MKDDDPWETARASLAKLGELALAIMVKKHPELAGKPPKEVIRELEKRAALERRRMRKKNF